LDQVHKVLLVDHICATQGLVTLKLAYQVSRSSKRPNRGSVSPLL
jgi:hypothetical protein